MHNRFRISQKILYEQILDVFLIFPYFQIIRGRDSILVYFHQLMVEPTVFFQSSSTYLFRCNLCKLC